MPYAREYISKNAKVTSASSKFISGNKDKDRELITFGRNYVRDEFKLLLRANYKNLRHEHIRKILENAGKSDGSNWQKHYQIMDACDDLQKSLPRRIVRQIQEKYPVLCPIEKWICCLFYFNFKPCEIAEILSCRNTTIHTISSRIRHKLNISGKDCISHFFEENL